MRGVYLLYPRGPRSGLGYSVPIHQHLIGPMRPTRRHIGISPLAAYTRCPRCAGAPRRPASGSVLLLPFCIDMSPSETPRSPAVAYTQFLPRRRWPSPRFETLGTSKYPQSDSRGIEDFVASLPFTCATTCRLVRPLSDLTEHAQPTGAFTSGLPTDWSPAPPPDMATVATGQVPPAGLPPARMTTSIAATKHPCGTHTVSVA